MYDEVNDQLQIQSQINLFGGKNDCKDFTADTDFIHHIMLWESC